MGSTEHNLTARHSNTQQKSLQHTNASNSTNLHCCYDGDDCSQAVTATHKRMQARDSSLLTQPSSRCAVALHSHHPLTGALVRGFQLAPCVIGDITPASVRPALSCQGTAGNLPAVHCCRMSKSCHPASWLCSKQLSLCHCLCLLPDS
jgi:hypothetical protein